MNKRTWEVSETWDKGIALLKVMTSDGDQLFVESHFCKPHGEASADLARRRCVAAFVARACNALEAHAAKGETPCTLRS